MSDVAAPALALVRGEPLSRHTSLKVGGPAERFWLARSPEEMIEALRLSAARGWPVVILGGGSNVLPSDEGVAGLVVKYLAGAHRLHVRGDRAVVEAEAGASLAGLARRLARQGWAGLEWAVNVPGTVGGAVVNNAGAFGSCVAECLLAVELVNAQGERRWLQRSDLDYAYRTSRLKRRELGAVAVLRAEFVVRRGDPLLLSRTVEHNQQMRTRSQPRQLSAGSVFANPPGDFAGRLIEQAGLKGLRRGGAQISSQHANFIVNLGSATARDVYTLMRAAQLAVWERERVWLRPEIELIGRWAEAELAALEAPENDGPPLAPAEGSRP